MPNLFQTLRSEDIQAFERFYVGNYALIRDYLTRWDISFEKAEDIAQDVLVVLWEKRNDFWNGDDKQFFKYIYTAAKRMAIKAKQEKKRQYKLTSELPQSFDDHVETPEELVISEQLQAKIDAALMSMPSVRYQIYQLKYNDCCTNKEIAERLNIDQNTVRWHIHIVKSTLNELLEAQ